MSTILTAWARPTYIIDLTKHMVGESNLRLKKVHSEGDDAGSLFRELSVHLQSKLAKMKCATLARICTYGTPGGYHREFSKTKVSFFRNRTGFIDLPATQVSVTMHDCHAVLVDMAMRVVVCVARDIILQERYQREDEVSHPSYYL